MTSNGDLALRPIPAQYVRFEGTWPEDFYTGEIRRRIAEDLEKNGAPVTARDLAECGVEVPVPLCGSCRGLAVATDPSPNVGALLIEIPNILEECDLQPLGQRPVPYHDLLARALYLVFRDRTLFVDPNYGLFFLLPMRVGLQALG